MVRSKGLEPLRAFTHQLLRLARLPIPPRPQAIILAAAKCTSEMFVCAAVLRSRFVASRRRSFEQQKTGPTNADRSLELHRRFIAVSFGRSRPQWSLSRRLDDFCPPLSGFAGFIATTS